MMSRTATDRPLLDGCRAAASRASDHTLCPAEAGHQRGPGKVALCYRWDFEGQPNTNDQGTKKGDKKRVKSFEPG